MGNSPMNVIQKIREALKVSLGDVVITRCEAEELVALYDAMPAAVTEMEYDELFRYPPATAD